MLWRIADSGRIEFIIRRLGVSTARGRFTRLEGVAEAGINGLPTRLELRIDASSVSTGNASLDRELRSPGFLDVERFPNILFRSSGLDWEDDHICTMRGELTLHGVTLPMSFLITVGGADVDAEGVRRVAAEAEGAIGIGRWDVHRPPGLRGALLAFGERVAFTAMVQAVAEPLPAG